MIKQALKSLKSIVLGTPDGPTVKVKLLGNISFVQAGKTISGCQGDEFVLSERDGRSMAAERLVEIIGQDEVDAQRQADLEAMLPVLRPPLPAPTGWENLPECFTNWHVKADRVAVYQERYAAIEKMIFAQLNMQTGNVSPISILPGDLNFRQRQTALSRVLTSSSQVIGLGLEGLNRREYLDQALHHAADELEDIATRSHDPIMVLFVQCSDLTIAAHGAMTKASGECKKIAFDLFSLRIKALGLADHQARRLFIGGADFVRYDLPADVPAMQDLRLGWSNGGSDPKFYLGIPVPIMAALYQKWLAEAARIGDLAVAAKKELFKASKAITAAA